MRHPSPLPSRPVPCPESLFWQRRPHRFAKLIADCGIFFADKDKHAGDQH
jgi:hypothetical protein